MAGFASRRRVVIVLGAALVGCVFAVSVANLVSGGQLVLVWRYALQAGLDRWAHVAELRVFTADNPRLFLDPDDVLMSRVIRTYGVWEAKETRWVLQSLREGDTFVDVGASLGYYTVLAAAAVGEGGRVVAFEPAPSSCALLRRNVRLNGYGNVTVEEKAVSNQPGSLRLYLAEENKGDHRIYQGSEPRPWVEVDAVTLDGYFDEVGGRVDVLKIDVQGADFAVLQGASGLLEANPDICITVEFSPSGLAGLGASGRDLLDFLSARDFVWFDLGIADSEVDRLEAVEAEWLLERHTVENESYTNLLAVRGKARLEDLRRRLARRLEGLGDAPPEVLAAEQARARRAVEELTRELLVRRRR